MADIVTLGLVHAQCLECRWVGEGFLTSAEARDDAEMWHVHRCPGPMQADADWYPDNCERCGRSPSCSQHFGEFPTPPGSGEGER